MTPDPIFPSQYLPERARRIAARLSPYSVLLTFAAGFLFDFFTMQRIDAWTDLAFQLAYLLGLTSLLVLQRRHETGRWTPDGRVARLWAYNVEALHFLYGGLLSAYVVLYFRSSTGARPLVFFLLLIAVMIVNEVPHIRRAGYQLRLGLYAFCVLSFLNYFVPILIGRMGGWVFTLALVLSAGVVWLVAHVLTRVDDEPAVQRWRLFRPAAVVCATVAVLYVLRLIPPVPLSVQFHGIYHDVMRRAGSYTLVYEAPSVLRFWRRDSRPFYRRSGDRVHYFARVFAPSRFRPRIVTVWESQQADGTWRASDRIPLPIVGGRTEGFRTFAYKSNFTPGRWRVTVETEDGRAVATLSFEVVEDRGTGERELRTVEG
jgi:hypothetical protein